MSKLHPTYIRDQYDDKYEVGFDFHLDGWYGYIKNIPQINCKSQSKTDILENLRAQLIKENERLDQEWDDQIKRDAEAGKLDFFVEEAKQALKEGRCVDLDDFLKEHKNDNTADNTALV